MSEHWSWNDPFLPEGEPVEGETYRADGWQYHDMNKALTNEHRSEFFGVVGEENIVVLASSQGADWWRAQMLVSPEGQANMKAYVAERKQ